MSPRELLELSAKAAGIEVIDWKLTAIRGYESVFSAVCQDNNDYDYFWNPLDNDGDALRLAVKLEMILGHDIQDRLAYAQLRFPHRVFDEFYGGTKIDCQAAMRLAIVRAAAEIGKEMQ